MKKIITIIIFLLFAVCISYAQVTIRSLKTDGWAKVLKENVTYILEPNQFSVKIKEDGVEIYQFWLSGNLTFNNNMITLADSVIINGITWATRNLAAHGEFVEEPEDFGALFQWGRKGDGHEQRTSPNYPTNDNSLENGTVSGSQNFDANGQIVSTHDAYGKFIKHADLYHQWRDPLDDILWNKGSYDAPIKTVNDPCPEGWRLPTESELITLGEGLWIDSPVPGRLFGHGENTLFLPATGGRGSNTGGIQNVNTWGCYWSSTPLSQTACGLFFSSSQLHVYGGFRAMGSSIRCVAE